MGLGFDRRVSKLFGAPDARETEEVMEWARRSDREREGSHAERQSYDLEEEPTSEVRNHIANNKARWSLLFENNVMT